MCTCRCLSDVVGSLTHTHTHTLLYGILNWRVISQNYSGEDGLDEICRMRRGDYFRQSHRNFSTEGWTAAEWSAEESRRKLGDEKCKHHGDAISRQGDAHMEEDIKYCSFPKNNHCVPEQCYSKQRVFVKRQEQIYKGLNKWGGKSHHIPEIFVNYKRGSSSLAWANY